MKNEAVATFLREHESAVLDTMMQARNPEHGPADEAHQFMLGYARVIQAAASGDLGPRDEYLATVIPAIKAGGMALPLVLEGMVRVSIAAAAALPGEHAKWVADFCGDYTVRILGVWGEH